MRFFLFFVLYLLTSPVFAQETVPPECRLLHTHKPNDSVAYREGVDVRGKPVVPADINADPIAIKSQSVIVPLSVDLAERLRRQNIAGLDLTAILGFIEVLPDGRVTYNGRDLTGEIHGVCSQKPEETAPAADRQMPPDTVKYLPDNAEGKRHE